MFTDNRVGIVNLSDRAREAFLFDRTDDSNRAAAPIRAANHGAAARARGFSDCRQAGLAPQAADFCSDRSSLLFLTCRRGHIGAAPASAQRLRAKKARRHFSAGAAIKMLGKAAAFFQMVRRQTSAIAFFLPTHFSSP
jgi:hypothetical protein